MMFSRSTSAICKCKWGSGEEGTLTIDLFGKKELSGDAGDELNQSGCFKERDQDVGANCASPTSLS